MLDDRCPHASCTGAYASTRDHGQTLARTSPAFLFVSAALAGSAAVLWFYDVKKRDKPSAVDFYLVMLARWARPMTNPPRSRPNIAKLLDKVTVLPAVRRAYEQEGVTWKQLMIAAPLREETSMIVSAQARMKMATHDGAGIASARAATRSAT